MNKSLIFFFIIVISINTSYSQNIYTDEVEDQKQWVYGSICNDLTKALSYEKNDTSSLTFKDSTQSSENSLSLNPRFSGFQFEFTSFLVVSELGGLADYDVFSSENNYHNIGARISIEYYHYLSLDVGGGRASDSPFLDYNLFARHTVKGSVFWMSILAGISIHTANKTINHNLVVLPRAGFELKYNLTRYEIGILLKGSTSLFEKNTSYLGIGFSFGFYSL